MKNLSISALGSRNWDLIMGDIMFQFIGSNVASDV
jgi:hypothetical protein